jgi:hypothetical protein
MRVCIVSLLVVILQCRICHSVLILVERVLVVRAVMYCKN